MQTHIMQCLANERATAKQAVARQKSMVEGTLFFCF